MFEQARLILYGQVTEERLWGVVLLALTSITALGVAYPVSQNWIGYQSYIAGTGAFLVTFFFVVRIWGTVLSKVREKYSEI